MGTFSLTGERVDVGEVHTPDDWFTGLHVLPERSPDRGPSGSSSHRLHRGRSVW